MRDDAELLRRYVEFHTEADFTELVGRHLSFVYHAALRRTGGRADLAEEVSQYVFTTLACKAPQLCKHPVLAGWLHTTTRHAGNTLLRTERRRSARELEAQRMNETNAGEAEPAWEQIRGELDRVLDQLSEKDREAILLRFFHNHAFARIGASCGLNEDAARKRVDRALERLRELLAKRGVKSTSAALATMLAGQAALAAPAGLTQTVAASALTHAAGTALPAGIIQFMGTKTTLGIGGMLGLAGLLIVPTVGIALYERSEAQAAQVALAHAQSDAAADADRMQKLQRDALETDRRAAEIQASLEKARAALAVKTSPPATSASPGNKAAEKARSDGDKFLATYPEVRAMLMEIGLAQNHRNYDGFSRFAQLPQTQREELERRTAEFWLESTALTPRSVNPTVERLPDDQLRQILGDAGLKQFQEYQDVRPAYEFAIQVSRSAGYLASPVSDEQSKQLAEAVLASSSSYRDTGKLDVNTVDVSAAYAQVRTILTPAQWEAAQPLLLEMQFKQALNRAHRQALSAAGEKPKS